MCTKGGVQETVIARIRAGWKRFKDVKQKVCGGGGGGFTRPIPRDGGADQFRGIPIVGRLPTDRTRGPEEKGCGRKWPDAEGLVQGSRARKKFVGVVVGFVHKIYIKRLYGAKCWPMKVNDIWRIESTQMRKLRMISGKTLKDKKASLR